MKEKLQAELTRLQKQYENKMASSAMVPPSILSSALSGIARKMDRIERQIETMSA